MFAHDPAAGTLTLFLEAVLASELPYVDPSWDEGSVAGNGGFVVAAPDNITVGPDGRLYLCEDGNGIEKVVGVNQKGELFDGRRSAIEGPAPISPDSEWMLIHRRRCDEFLLSHS